MCPGLRPIEVAPINNRYVYSKEALKCRPAGSRDHGRPWKQWSEAGEFGTAMGSFMEAFLLNQFIKHYLHITYIFTHSTTCCFLYTYPHRHVLVGFHSL